MQRLTDVFFYHRAPHPFVGSTSAVSRTVDLLGTTMVGLGCMEAKNSNTLVQGDAEKNLGVSPNTVLRSSLHMMDYFILYHTTCTRRIHKDSLRIGTVFNQIAPVNEQIHLCATLAHGRADYTEKIATSRQSYLDLAFEAKFCRIRESIVNIRGKSASVQVDGKKIGVVGAVDDAVLSDRKIRQLVSAFEIDISGLIFD